MGYTHYWRRKERLNEESFKAFVNDFKRVMPVFERLGIKLAGPMGTGEPIVKDYELAFNGLTSCGHKHRDLGITWPAKGAHGISLAYKEGDFKDEKLNPITKDGIATVLIGNPIEWAQGSDVKGVWFAGANLESRTCGGDCSHESFGIEIKKTQNTWDKGELVFDCTKTAYKPYDLAVTVALVIAKHHFGEDIKVSSDGDMENWMEAVYLCEKILGYGREFRLPEGEE